MHESTGWLSARGLISSHEMGRETGGRRDLAGLSRAVHDQHAERRIERRRFTRCDRLLPS